MAIAKEKITQAVSEMIANPDWKEILFSAPGAANLRIALAFYASKFLKDMTSEEKDEYREYREMLEAQLDAEELTYLKGSFARMGFEPAEKHYGELLSKFPLEEQQKALESYRALAKKAETGSNPDSEPKGEGEGDAASVTKEDEK